MGTAASPSPPLEERVGERRPFYSLVSVGGRSSAGPRLACSQRAPTLHFVNPTGNARRLRRKQTREEAQLWQSLRVGRFAGSNSDASIRSADTFWTFIVPQLGWPLNWTALSTACLGSRNMMRREISPWQPRTLRSCASGIISGAAIRKVSCGRSGTLCSGARAACKL